MKKIVLLTIVLTALSLNLSAFDVVTDTSNSAISKKPKAVEDMTTMDKFTKSKK